jgi:hypothetical protein
MANHGSPAHDDTRIAVLIDCDNVSPTHAGAILEEMAAHGTPTIKRAYGDWTTSQLNGWKKELNRWAIQPVQQFAYTVGKNSTDSALIIDAMDLMWMGNVEAFAIVSSDSDFTRLATRLGRRKSPVSLRNAVDQFIYLELLGEGDNHDDEAAQEPAARQEPKKSSGRGPKTQDTKPEAAEAPSTSEPDAASGSGSGFSLVPTFSSAPEPQSGINLQSALTKAVNATSGDDGWASLSLLGQHLNRAHADFDSRDFGHRKLSDLVTEQSYLDHRTDGGQMWVRLRGRSGGRRND